MTPFKFGKKKAKDATPSNTPSRDTSFSSPSAGQTTVSNNNTTATQGGSPHSSNPSINSHRKASNTLAAETSTNGIQYDHNNNLRSPQRPQQHHAAFANNNTPRKTSHNNPQFPQLTAQPWTKAKLLISPFPRYRHTASTVSNDKGELFVMGGLHNTSVYGDTWLIRQDEQRNFQTLQVEITENSPVPRVGHASTTCGNAYVIFGGDTVSNQDGEIDNDLYLFNMNSHTWSVPKPIGKKPSGRYGHKIGVIAITNFDSKVYLFGGQLDDNIFDDLVVFNLSSFRRPDVQWEWVTPSSSIRPSGLTNHTMDVYDNKLWVFGGFNGKSLTNDLWCYDPVPNSWSLVNTYGTAPPPLEEHASVVFKDLLIIHGGKKADGDASRDLFFYSFSNKSWFKLPTSFTNFPGKFGHTISILKGDRLVLLGGQLPDYAKAGESIEPTMDDQGVGTILNILDLSNLNKLIPGLQPAHLLEPLTPKIDEGSANRFGSASSQPETQHTGSLLKSPVSLSRSSALPQVKAPVPDFKGHHRGLSAEDIFKREHPESSSKSSQFVNHDFAHDEESPDLSVDVEDAFSQDSPLKNRKTSTAQAPEEELPLDLPSPIRTNDAQLSKEHPIDSVANSESLNVGGFNNYSMTKDTEPKNDKALENVSSTNEPVRSSLAESEILDTVLSSAVAKEVNLSRKPSLVDVNEKKQFKDLIKLLSTELENLKVSTNEKIKEASDKIIHLEEENKVLKSQQQEAKFLETEPVNENEIKRRNHRLNSEYTILSLSHADLQAQYEEMKPVFSENLIDLSKLNEIIKEQNEKIADQKKQLEDQENWKVKYEELQVRFYDVETKNVELRNTQDDKFFQSQEYIKQLNVGLDSFLQKYVTKDVATGAVEVKEISPKSSISGGVGSVNPETVKSLRSEIESLIADNEAFEAKTNSLSSEIEHLRKEIQTHETTNKSLGQEVSLLKVKEEELSTVRAKLVELDARYKDSLHSVANSSKALQLSESELSKQRDLNKTLLNDLEEIKLKKSSSRNVTPIINDFKRKKSVGSSGLQESTGLQEEEEEEEEDFENSHFSLKIRDLQAELYIIKQERDELKENVLKLKKDLFIANQKN